MACSKKWLLEQLMFFCPAAFVAVGNRIVTACVEGMTAEYTFKAQVKAFANAELVNRLVCIRGTAWGISTA
jgi:hypothetical protein